ncbi:MAG: hypothetical protein ACRBCT_09965 [Alphaproteobacteria bacterium]
MSTNQITFTQSKTVQAKPDFYMPVTLDIGKTLKSWQLSIFSHEWLEETNEGKAQIKPTTALKKTDQAKRSAIESALQNGAPLESPVLGIGIQDNVEIGSGKAILCTLAANGIKTIPAYIPKSNEEDFKPFLAAV